MTTENSKDIVIFFTLFNEVLEKVSGKKGYKSNPRAYVCDEGGANHKAICMVIGDNYCKDYVFGCQFHFMNVLHKKKLDVVEDLRETFIELCERLVKKVTNVTKYNILKGRIDEIAKSILLSLDPLIGGMKDGATSSNCSVEEVYQE